MEKILLAAFFSALAGFITAVLSIVKLVNEKENKISEFRQEWTNSARSSISDLSAKLAAISANLEYQYRLQEVEDKLFKKTGPIYEKRQEHVTATLLRVRGDIASNRHDLHQSYALCKLHFKPGDKDFCKIERLYEKIRAENKSMTKKDDAERRAVISENYDRIQALVEVARSILKNEWERVKEGENTFKSTKKYSLIGGTLTLITLIAVGGYALATAADADTARESSFEILAKKNEERPGQINCWELHTLDKIMFRFNSCSGELIEVDTITHQSMAKQQNDGNQMPPAGTPHKDLESGVATK